MAPATEAKSRSLPGQSARARPSPSPSDSDNPYQNCATPLWRVVSTPRCERGPQNPYMGALASSGNARVVARIREPCHPSGAGLPGRRLPLTRVHGFDRRRAGFSSWPAQGVGAPMLWIRSIRACWLTCRKPAWGRSRSEIRIMTVVNTSVSIMVTGQLRSPVRPN